MIRPVFGGGTSADLPAGAAERRRRGRGDRAMDVLQYGVALVAIVVVMLLAGAR